MEMWSGRSELAQPAATTQNREDVLRSALISGGRRGSMMVSRRYGSSNKHIVAILHVLPTTTPSLADKTECRDASRSVMTRAENYEVGPTLGGQWPKCQLVIGKELSNIN
jgi:hypothetical protein